MKIKKASTDEDSATNIYQLSKLTKTTLPLGGLLMMLIGFSLHFNTEQFLAGIINKQLKSLRPCQLSVNEITTEVFTLGFNLSKITPGAKCPKEINLLKNVYVGFRGLSFSPLGIKLKINTSISQMPKDITITTSLGITSYQLLIDDQSVQLEAIQKVIATPIKFKGAVSITGIISGSYRKLKEASMELKSNQLRLPRQEVQSLILPSINLSDNLINLKINDKNELLINSLKLGASQDLAQILIEGSINNIKSAKSARFDLHGKFKIGNELNKEIPLLGLMLNGKKKKQGFYQFKLNGNAARPNFKVQ